jgi:peroxin-3
MAELETERITFQLQEQKASKLAKAGDEIHPSDLGSAPPSVTDDDGRSNISTSESGLHASQVSVPSAGAGPSTQDGAHLQPKTAKKSKLQLWNDLKISGRPC